MIFNTNRKFLGRSCDQLKDHYNEVDSHYMTANSNEYGMIANYSDV